jgi:uncharacterized protein YndB with AHSA1/START domain
MFIAPCVLKITMRFGFLLLVITFPGLFVACGSAEQPPYEYDALETITMNRPESAGVVCRFKTRSDAETIWKSLTVPEELRRWAADSAKVDLTNGGVYQLWLKNGEFISRPISSFVIGKKLSHVGDLKGSWVTWQIEPLKSGGALVTYAAMGISDEWRAQVDSKKVTCSAFVSSLVDYLQ